MYFCSICKRFLVSPILRMGVKQLHVPRLSYKSLSRQEENPIPQQSYVTSATNESVVIYRWPTMRHFRFVSRFKLYQVSTMFLLIPPLCWWYSTGVISGPTLTYATLSSVGTAGVLSVLSYYFTRVAGEMAVIGDKLRVSTLTFMGGRRNLEYPLLSVVPFADSNVGGAVQRLEVIGERTHFMYSLRYGRIVNKNIFESVLGITNND